MTLLNFVFLNDLSFFSSQAVIADKTMYVSGQLGLNPETMEFVSDDVQDQTKQVREAIGRR